MLEELCANQIVLSGFILTRDIAIRSVWQQLFLWGERDVVQISGPYQNGATAQMPFLVPSKATQGHGCTILQRLRPL